MDDPFATAKANMRDTVKWLASTFAGLAAVVLAGSPFSGFGSLAFGSVRFWCALVGLLVGVAVLVHGWRMLMLLLRSDAVYPAQLRSDYSVEAQSSAEEQAEIKALRADIERHRVDLFPKNVATFESLEDKIAEFWKQANRKDADEESRAIARKRYEQYQETADYIVNYAGFARLHQRLRDAIPKIEGVGLAALAGLAVFAYASTPQKSDDGKLAVLAPYSTCAEACSPAAVAKLESVYFATGRADITPAGVKAVGTARDFLLAHPGTALLMLAHTDTVASDSLNRDLAKRRADAVRRLLVDHGGLAPARIFVAELSKTDLPRLTKDETPEQLNRAVEFIVVRVAQPASEKQAKPVN